MNWLTRVLQLFLVVIFFGVAHQVYAATQTETFSGNESSYTFDSTKIEFVGGAATLKQSSTWYNSSWTYRQLITLTNTGARSVTNYAVKIELSADVPGFWSLVESDGRSLRFTDSSGTTLLSSYDQSFDVASQTATIWVEIPTLAARTTQNIYMYYGNTSATSVSAINDVFYFGDDFNDNLISSSKWITVDANSVFSASGGTLIADSYEGGSLWHGMYADPATYAVSRSRGLIFEADFDTYDIANKDQNLLLGFKDTTTESAAQFLAHMPYNFYIVGPYSAGGTGYTTYWCENGGTCTNTGAAIAVNTSYSVRILAYPESGADFFIKGGAYTDWTFLGRSTFVSTGSIVPAFTKQEAKYTFNNIRMRQMPSMLSGSSEVFPRNAATSNFTTSSATAWEDPNGLGEQAVIYEDGLFKMWYSSSSSIGLATSTDGITWNRYHANPVFGGSGTEGAFDKLYANRADIFKSDSVYYMYYNGFNAQQSGVGKIGLATSSDGINWTRYANNPILTVGTGWEDFSLYNAAVAKAGSTWYMLYEGKGWSDYTQIIGLATSTDGYTWTKYSGNPVIRKGNPANSAYAAAPNLIYNDGMFYTWLMGRDARTRYFLTRGESSDAITWKFAESPDIYAKYGWEYISVSDASNPVEYNGETYMYYVGGNQSSIASIGLMKYPGTLAQLLTSSTPYREASTSTGVMVSQYATSSPSIATLSGIAYSDISSFAATTSTAQTTFQISPDNSTWYYWNGSAWTSTSDSAANSNTATVVNTNIAAFVTAYPNSTFYWRGYIAGTGLQATALNSVVVGYSKRVLSGAAGYDSVRLSWSGNGSTYSILNSTTGAQTSYFSGSSYNATGLVCGRAYSFTLYEKDAAGTQTGVTEAISVTPLCSSVTSGTSSGTVAPLQSPEQLVSVAKPQLVRTITNDLGTFLVWNGQTAQYQVNNRTANVRSDWFFGNTYKVSASACNQPQTFEVRGRDSDIAVSDFSETISVVVMCQSGPQPITDPPPVQIPVVTPPAEIPLGIYEKSVIRVGKNTALYYIFGGKRYVFPNSVIYKTWYKDFAQVKTLTLEEVTQLHLGGVVKPKAGSIMVKITTDPKVYFVGNNGTLRWVSSERVAKDLFGTKWAKNIIDISDADLNEYRMGSAIMRAEDAVVGVETEPVR